MTKKSIFITATGTDIGKTYVSALLVKKLRDNNINCGYYKPVLSGAIRQNDGTLLPGDCDFVLKTSNLKRNPMDCLSYCFEEAVSPHLASERQNIQIKKEVIEQDYEKISEQFDYLVVEGAGGITCPFNLKQEKLLLNDIIKYLGLDVIIVADGGLGTINSILLTVEYAKQRGINIKGIILNNYIEDDFMHQDNLKQVENLTGIKVIATVKKQDKDLNININELLKVFV